MIGKLRTQLLLVLLFFGATNSLIIITYIFQNKQKERVEIIEDYLHQIEVLIHSDTKEINNYFTYDTKNPDYFINNKSRYLDKHKHQLFIIDLIKKRLTNAEGFSKLKSESLIEKLSDDLDSLNHIVLKISDEIYERGFKDFGIEGTMRQHAHNLEQISVVPKSELLMLRRHEKDYIIRNESKYIKRFNEKALYLERIIVNKNISAAKKLKIREELKHYTNYFNKLVKADSLIGLKTNSALKADLDKAIQLVLSDAKLLNQNCNIYKTKLYKRLKRFSIYILLSIIILSILLSFKFSKKITNRVSLLSANTTEFIESCFTKLEPLTVKKRNDEVGKLIENFELLKQNIVDQIHYLEVKVNQRTEEINTQKEQILAQNKKMMDSVRYALNIQEAILPHKDYIGQTFPEHFIFYRPKDLVSGDFYWFKRITRSKVDYSVLAVADCTGHGVPGAFMSMLGVSFLNEIVVHKNITDAADVLNKLRQKIIDNLAQQNNTKKINDGMDISLIIVDHKSNKLQFSGAHRDLTIIKNGELDRIKGDRMPIGRHIKDYKSFTNHELIYEPKQLLYMYSDGFADQHGGPNYRKYLRKRLRQLLQDLSYYPMAQQKSLIERELNSWMGTNDQTDDILVAGIRL